MALRLEVVFGTSAQTWMNMQTADSYVKYLLKSAVLKSSHLKIINILCLDPDGSVKSRYDEFIKFKYYRFINANVLEYRNNIYRIQMDLAEEVIRQKRSMIINHLEDAHNDFFKKKILTMHFLHCQTCRPLFATATLFHAMFLSEFLE